MGQDVHCIATWNGRRSIGTASLETDDLLFRGEFRLRIPFKTVTDLAADEGRLTVTIAEGTVIFNLGVRAQQWAERIRNPKGVLDKLGIKPEMLVSVLGVPDQWFLDELTSRVQDVRVGKVARSSDVIVAAINTPKELTVFEKLQASDTAEIVQEPTEQFWGTRDFAVRDPSGNLVRIDQPPMGDS